MKEASVDIGKLYALRSQTGGEVTNENGETLETLEANKQQHITAQESVWLVPDDCKVTKANFKYALAALGLLGGGNTLPAGYTRLEYVGGATGAYFSIPEGFNYTDELHSGIELEFVMLKITSSSSYIWLIGEVPNPDRGQPYIGSAYTDTVQAGMYADGGAAGLEKVAGKSYSARWNFCDDGLCSIYSGSEGNFADMRTRMEKRVKGVTPHAAQNLLAKTGESYRPEQSSYYGVKRVRFSQNTQVTRDLVAALDETGAPCLFDLVSRTPFYNAGTGDFVYPTERTTYGLRRVLPDWGKLTENGLRRLYHTPANYEGELYDYALENGYKPIVEEPAPEEGYWVPVWHDREECIELEWVETEPPAEEELLTIEA